MSSFGTIPLKRILKMLEECGCNVVDKGTFYRVHLGEMTFPRLPKGQAKNPGIEVGHVRSMCNCLGIMEYAQKNIEALMPKNSKKQKPAPN